jgi:hypothetical protein
MSVLSGSTRVARRSASVWQLALSLWPRQMMRGIVIGSLTFLAVNLLFALVNTGLWAGP